MLGTVPPGARWLVKYVALYNGSGGPTSSGIATEQDGDYSILAWQADIPAQAFYREHEMYGVLEAGDDLVLFVFSAATPALYYHVGGLVFEL